MSKAGGAVVVGKCLCAIEAPSESQTKTSFAVNHIALVGGRKRTLTMLLLMRRSWERIRASRRKSGECGSRLHVTCLSMRVIMHAAGRDISSSSLATSG